jgi:hypothetical protein
MGPNEETNWASPASAAGQLTEGPAHQRLKLTETVRFKESRWIRTEIDGRGASSPSVRANLTGVDGGGSAASWSSGEGRRRCSAMLSAMRSRMVAAASLGEASIDGVAEVLARQTPAKLQQWRG